jgi:O-antigen/teichoic acid export membrane protein
MVLAVVVLPAAVSRLFGQGYLAAVPACVLLAVAGPLLVLNRLGVSILFGQGRFRVAGLHAGLRVLAVPAALWLGWNLFRLATVTGAAAAWLAVEAVCALALAWAWKGRPLASDREQQS